jgi:hypothetical protein
LDVFSKNSLYPIGQKAKKGLKYTFNGNNLKKLGKFRRLKIEKSLKNRGLRQFFCVKCAKAGK